MTAPAGYGPPYPAGAGPSVVTDNERSPAPTPRSVHDKPGHFRFGIDRLAEVDGEGTMRTGRGRNPSNVQTRDVALDGGEHEATGRERQVVRDLRPASQHGRHSAP